MRSQEQLEQIKETLFNFVNDGRDPYSKQILNDKNAQRDAHFKQIKALFSNLTKEEKKEIVNAKKKYSRTTLLHLAAEEGHLKIAKLLIENGADVNAKHSLGGTPLHLAASRDHLKIAKLLIENGADVNAKDSLGGTPLHLAASRDHLKIAKLLIENGADVNAKDSLKETAFYFATKRRHLEIAKLLIENGADVNTKASSGTTLFHWALENDHLEIVKFLIENGADVNVKDAKNGQTVLYLAIKRDYFFEITINRPYLEITKLLIENGADVNAKTNDSQTPLHLAVEEGNLDIVKLLIANDADVNAKANNGTPLHLAVGNYQKNHLKIAKLLIENGADVNAFGKTVLHSAAMCDNIELVNLILNEGAEVARRSLKMISKQIKNGNLQGVVLAPHPKKEGVYYNVNAKVKPWEREKRMQTAKTSALKEQFAMSTTKFEVSDTGSNTIAYNVANQLVQYFSEKQDLPFLILFRSLSKRFYNVINEHLPHIPAFQEKFFENSFVHKNYSKHFKGFYNNPSLLLEENKEKTENKEEPKKPEKTEQQDKEASSEKPSSHVAMVEAQRKSKCKTQENPEKLGKRDSLRKKISDMANRHKDNESKDDDQPEQLRPPKYPSSRRK